MSPPIWPPAPRFYTTYNIQVCLQFFAFNCYISNKVHHSKWTIIETRVSKKYFSMCFSKLVFKQNYKTAR
ncbi:hypothetical protein T06_10521 [Trichinella sp. T6]|nr:hypothetical protein T06_10521 [Trichinella sp. T6]